MTSHTTTSQPVSASMLKEASTTTRDSQEDLSGPPAANRHRLRASSLFDPPAPAKATEIEITEEDEILAEIRENENQNDDIGDAG